MGRSQVLRNCTHGRPGQGRGRGRGSSSSRGNGSSVRRNLGDNAFRFERNNVSDGGDEYYGGLLGDIDLISSSSHYGSEMGGDSEIDSASYYGDNEKGEIKDSYLSIDISALSKCLSECPLYERLNIPWHVGQHLQNQRGSGKRKGTKSLPEIREDSKCIFSVDEAFNEYLGSSCKETSSVEHILSRQPSSKVDESKNEHSQKDPTIDGNDEEDLESWLDDMISC